MDLERLKLSKAANRKGAKVCVLNQFSNQSTGKPFSNPDPFSNT